jgi:hypothetical protein
MKSVRTLLFGLVLCLTMLGANAIAQVHKMRIQIRRVQLIRGIQTVSEV